MSGAATMLRRLVRWETLLALVVIGLIVLGASVSPVFLTARNFTNLVSAVMEVALMALPMTLIIVAAEIDLSVESMAGLAVALLGVLFLNGVGLELAIPIVLAVGALVGLLNGVLVTSVGLPSLVVTLGTLALFRGLALAVLGAQGVSGFPDWFTEFGFGTVLGSAVGNTNYKE
jgi:rhamnose transport system permease protein